MIGNVATVQMCVAPNVGNGRYLLGLCFIVLQSFVWISASVITQYMFRETAIDSPFLMTYIGVAECMVLFPLKWLIDRFSNSPEKDQQDLEQKKDSDSFDEAIEKATDYSDILDTISVHSRQNAKTKKPWNHRKHALAALQ